MSSALSLPGAMEMANVTVKTTSNRGFNAKELSDRCLEKLISVGENVDPVLQKQALQYRENIRLLLLGTCEQAQRSERTTVCAKLEEAGFSEAAAYLRSI